MVTMSKQQIMPASAYPAANQMPPKTNQMTLRIAEREFRMYQVSMKADSFHHGACP
jgi:hypothetical protein